MKNNGHQLRCRSKLHGIIKHFPPDKYSSVERDLLEVRCKDKWCSERNGMKVVVLHYFNVVTGELEHTTKYKDPRLSRRKVEVQ